VRNRIRELRLERAHQFPAAFSITALARRLGVGERTIRYWEDGQTRPTSRHAGRLARDFAVTVADLGLDGHRQDGRLSAGSDGGT
jgi:transcriptional regulator with XRE-family HTH domain